jgi:phenylalanyl-tRNA synthetase beta chain
MAQYAPYTMFHPGRVGGITLDGEHVIGLFGEMHPRLQEKMGLKQPVFMFELAFDPVVESARLVPAYTPYSVYPETSEALSFIVDERQAVGPMVEALKTLDPRIASIEVGKPYMGNQIELGKQAVTFEFVYQSKEGPIKEKEAEELRSMISNHMREFYKTILRGNS